MNENQLTKPALFTPLQIIISLFVLVGLIIALDFQRRENEGELISDGHQRMQQEFAIELTRSVELVTTLHYVESDDYVVSYARQEAGYILPGEKRVVPLLKSVTVTPISNLEQPTPDPLYDARPWQAWWRLLTDLPQPKRP